MMTLNRVVHLITENDKPYLQVKTIIEVCPSIRPFFDLEDSHLTVVIYLDSFVLSTLSSVCLSLPASIDHEVDEAGEI